MDKQFYDVFPSLKLKSELDGLMKLVTVSRVASNRTKTQLRVYITSERWIHKKYIDELAEQIRIQMFPGMNMDIRVIEKFRLSTQYTPENFFGTYRSSMEYELNKVSHVEHTLFHQAEIDFPEPDHLVMKLPSSLIAEEKEKDLTEYLEKVFCERCGIWILRLRPSLSAKRQASPARIRR